MQAVMANSVTVKFWRHYQLQRKRSSKVHKLRFYKKRHDRRDAGPKDVALPDKKNIKIFLYTIVRFRKFWQNCFTSVV